MATTKHLPAGGLLLALALPGAAVGADFDGSKTLMCAAIDVVACAEAPRGPVCSNGNARTFELAEFFRIDFGKKEVRATGNNANIVSPVRHQENTETQTILQGVENDRGWSLAVDQESGHFSLSVAGKDLGFMILGACTAL